MSIRYAGVYSGPSYGTYDPRDGFEGFTSLEEARDAFSNRQATSGARQLPSLRLTVNADYQVTDYADESTCWPATSPEDTLELYAVDRDRVSPEPFARLSAGPRGGVIRENY
jgi:hypothetical protein